jgi:hypothetical protein
MLILAFVLSGAEALAAAGKDDCCQKGHCARRTGAPAEDTRGTCPVSCHACPCARILAPVLGQSTALPELVPSLACEWWEPPMKPARPHTRGVFQPPRAG